VYRPGNGAPVDRSAGQAGGTAGQDGGVTRAPTRVVVLGGGPGGYEASLVAAQLGAEVTVVEAVGVGGSAVLTDSVPSKTLVATAQVLTRARESGRLGLGLAPVEGTSPVDLAAVNARIRDLAAAQSHDIATSLAGRGVRVLTGTGRIAGRVQGPRGGHRVVWSVGADPGSAAAGPGGGELIADVLLVATGARPRAIPDAVPDGERILSWTQLYGLTALPDHLIVIGSGVTGAEFAGAYRALGARVTLVSSRDRVLPGEDADAARVLQQVFARRGMTVLSRSRAVSVHRTGPGGGAHAGTGAGTGDGVVVRTTDGREVVGSHCLVAVGSVPNTSGIGLAQAGLELGPSGHVAVDRVSRTGVPGVYAAGDCTGVLLLASVAAMQGRIAMWHALGDAVAPLDLDQVCANVFTDPEIATVGPVPDATVRTVTLPLAGNARAKMQGFDDGFVKLHCRPATGVVTGGVVVAPGASELVHPLSVAVAARLTVDQVAQAFTVYPSLSGSIAEAARRLHPRAPT